MYHIMWLDEHDSMRQVSGFAVSIADIYTRLVADCDVHNVEARDVNGLIVSLAQLRMAS